MNDLNTLLERAAGPATAPVDAQADLTRGHRALRRTRRRRTSLGLVGVAATGVVGIGITRYVDKDVPAQHRATEQDSQRDARIRLLAQPFEAGPYSFDNTPAGWEVQGAYPAAVTIAPVGFPDQEPLSFTGKLVILFDNNPLGDGVEVEADGRTLRIREGDDYTTISTRTRADEPQGVLRIQYPSDTGWSRETMVAFLAGVHVGQGAQPGVG